MISVSRGLLPIAAALGWLLQAEELCAQFQTGDIAAAESPSFSGVSIGWVEKFTPTLNGQIFAQYADTPRSVAFDAQHNLYVALTDSIDWFDSTGTSRGTFASLPGLFPTSQVFDRNGDSYVGQRFAPQQLLKLDAAGNVTRTYDLSSITPDAPFAVDLAADQCTLFFVHPFLTSLKRYDVCTGTPLADLPTALPSTGSLSALRVLNDGTFLVANNDAVYRLSASGAILQTFSRPGGSEWRAVALSPSGETFYATSGAAIQEFRLSDGALIRGPASTVQRVNALAVAGEPRAALGPEPVPTFSPFVALTLAVCLALIAWRAVG